MRNKLRNETGKFCVFFAVNAVDIITYGGSDGIKQEIINIKTP